MKVPDKITTYRESTIYLFPIILKEIRNKDMHPLELWEKTKKSICNLSSFIDALDCLYILGKIDIDLNSGVLHYAKRNNM